jgi:hypothetical protein
MNGFKLVSLADGTALMDGVNKSQLDLKANITALSDYVKRDGTLAMTGSLNANSNKIINVPNGTVANDAVNKSQLDTKRDVTARDDSIQHSTTNTAITCSTANKIDIKVNGANRGYFQQPVG